MKLIFQSRILAVIKTCEICYFTNLGEAIYVCCLHESEYTKFLNVHLDVETWVSNFEVSEYEPVVPYQQGYVSWVNGNLF